MHRRAVDAKVCGWLAGHDLIAGDCRACGADTGGLSADAVAITHAVVRVSPALATADDAGAVQPVARADQASNTGVMEKQG